MTTTQLHLFNVLYLVVLVVVAILTRATARRIAGALAGGAVAGVVALGIVALGEEVGWWHLAITWEPYFLTLMLIDFALCRVHFPHHLADRPPVRLARAGRGRGRRGGHRAAAGLLVHEAVPGMGQLRAGGRPCPRDLRDLRPVGARGARGDAAGRRTGRRGPAGPPPVGGRLTLKADPRHRPSRARRDLSCRSILLYHGLMAADFRDVERPSCGLPPSASWGPTPKRFTRQIARFGNSTDGMPPVWVYEGSDGVLEIINGATRAAPGLQSSPRYQDPCRGDRDSSPTSWTQNPKVGDRL